MPTKSEALDELCSLIEDWMRFHASSGKGGKEAFAVSKADEAGLKAMLDNIMGRPGS